MPLDGVWSENGLSDCWIPGHIRNQASWSQTPRADHTEVVFARDVHSLTQVMGEMGNPFCDDTKDLLVLDSRDLADPAIINNLRQIEKLGQEQHGPMSMRDLSTRQGPSLTQSKETTSLSSSDLHCSLHLGYVMETSMSSLCTWEPSMSPSTLTHGHSCHSWAQLGKKSDLVGCLKDLAPPQENAAAASPAAEVIIFDGAAIINMLPTGTGKTFNEYARQQVCHTSHLSCSMRVGWMLSAMNTSQAVWRQTLGRNEVKAPGDEPSHPVPFLETAWPFFVQMTTRWSCLTS